MMCDVIQVAKIKFMCMCHDATFSLLVSIFTPYYARYMIRTTSISLGLQIIKNHAIRRAVYFRVYVNKMQDPIKAKKPLHSGTFIIIIMVSDDL